MKANIGCDDIKCVVYNVLDEDLSHLFFICVFSWRVWCACCEW